MKRFCLLLGCLLFSISASAQLYQRTITRLMRQTDVAFQRSLAAKLPQSTLSKSVLLLQELQPVPGYLPALIQASAFVIEDSHNGKKQLWGVTASHYRFAKPQVTHLQSNRRLRTQIYAQGGGGVNDIAIFPIPYTLKDKVVPLKLAEHGPQLGDEVHSVGFFADEIHHETGRTVQSVAPHRVLTSLNVANPGDRIGACGGPILNARNEVVGVHVSSSKEYQTGGVVPVEHIRQLLSAYHNHTALEQPIYFNGVRLGQLGINEFISEISLYNGVSRVRKVPLLHHNKNVDYDHLEKLVNPAQGTQIILVIQQQPLLPLVHGHTPHAFLLSYDLRTGEIEKVQNDEFIPL